MPRRGKMDQRGVLTVMALPSDFHNTFAFLQAGRVLFFRTVLRLSSRGQKVLRVVVVDADGDLFIYNTDGDLKRQIRLPVDTDGLTFDNAAAVVHVRGQHDLALDFHPSRQNVPEATLRRFVHVIRAFIAPHVTVRRAAHAFDAIRSLENDSKTAAGTGLVGAFLKGRNLFGSSPSLKRSTSSVEERDRSLQAVEELEGEEEAVKAAAELAASTSDGTSAPPSADPLSACRSSMEGSTKSAGANAGQAYLTDEDLVDVAGVPDLKLPSNASFGSPAQNGRRRNASQVHNRPSVPKGHRSLAQPRNQKSSLASSLGLALRPDQTASSLTDEQLLPAELAFDFGYFAPKPSGVHSENGGDDEKLSMAIARDPSRIAIPDASDVTDNALAAHVDALDVLCMAARSELAWTLVSNVNRKCNDAAEGLQKQISDLHGGGDGPVADRGVRSPSAASEFVPVHTTVAHPPSTAALGNVLAMVMFICRRQRLLAEARTAAAQEAGARRLLQQSQAELFSSHCDASLPRDEDSISSRAREKSTVPYTVQIAHAIRAVPSKSANVAPGGRSQSNVASYLDQLVRVDVTPLSRTKPPSVSDSAEFAGIALTALGEPLSKTYTSNVLAFI